MPRPKLADITRFHHLTGIPVEYQAVLYTQQLRYSAHANSRYARRAQHLVPAGDRPNYIDSSSMQLLAADVAGDKVVMQVWRAPLEGLEQDLVLAVSDLGKVATVWVVERDDEDGIWRPKPELPAPPPARSPHLGAMFAATVSLPIEPGNTALWGAISARRSRATPFDRAQLDEVGLRPA